MIRSCRTREPKAFFKFIRQPHLRAPADVVLHVSDGHWKSPSILSLITPMWSRGNLRKVQRQLHQSRHRWLGGFGDLTVTNPAPWKRPDVLQRGGKVSTFLYKKLDDLEKWLPALAGGKGFVGIEDRYFTAANFFPPTPPPGAHWRTRYWKAWRPCT